MRRIHFGDIYSQAGIGEIVLHVKHPYGEHIFLLEYLTSLYLKDYINQRTNSGSHKSPKELHQPFLIGFNSSHARNKITNVITEFFVHLFYPRF